LNGDGAGKVVCFLRYRARGPGEEEGERYTCVATRHCVEPERYAVRRKVAGRAERGVEDECLDVCAHCLWDEERWVFAEKGVRGETECVRGGRERKWYTHLDYALVTRIMRRTESRPWQAGIRGGAWYRNQAALTCMCMGKPVSLLSPHGGFAAQGLASS